MDVMNELNRNLASERFGDSKVSEGTAVLAGESSFATGFFWEDLLWRWK